MSAPDAELRRYQAPAELAGVRLDVALTRLCPDLSRARVQRLLEEVEDGFDSIRVESIDAAHFLQEEKPREVAAVMNAFFKTR